MSVRSVLKVLYFLALLTEIAIRLPHDRRRRRNRISVDQVTTLERSLIGLVLVGIFCLPALHAFTPWLDRANYRLSRKGERRAGAVGVAFLAVAVWLFRRSHADLGRNWSPSLQLREDHTLATDGVYRRVRHPMYASEWLWGIGQILVLQNWISGWAGLVLFAPLYALRVPREEGMMIERFGKEYRAYMDRTGRVMPRI